MALMNPSLWKEKYWQPGSMLWTSAIPPLAAGLFIASEPVHRLADYVQFVNNITNNTGAFPLLTSGFALLGISGRSKSRQ